MMSGINFQQGDWACGREEGGGGGGWGKYVHVTTVPRVNPDQRGYTRFLLFLRTVIWGKMEVMRLKISVDLTSRLFC